MRPTITSSSSSSTSSSSKAVGRPRKYGDIENSDFVHDEIKELGNQIKSHLKQFQVKDEASLLNNLRMSGPSEQSKAQLRKELEGAQQSIQSGVYYVYRNVAPPKMNPRTGKPFMSRQQEECCRLGASHSCFCGHPLSSHTSSSSSSTAMISKRGGGGSSVLPPCSACDCSKFTYIPNQPEEVGDGFLSRRKGFVAEAWSAKCKCGCGSRSHDPVTKSCRACRKCYGFEGNFLCGVCDGRWEEHATLVESESDRRGQGLATGNDYLPLAQVDPEFREIVYGEETAKALPPSSSQLTRKQIMGGSSSSSVSASASSGAMTRAQREHLRAFESSSSSSSSTNRRVVEEVDDDHNQQQYSRRPPAQQQQQQYPAPSSSSSAQNNNNDNPHLAMCPQCNQGNRRLAKFCRACGAKM